MSRTSINWDKTLRKKPEG